MAKRAHCLDEAWSLRERRGWLAIDALRVFHGPVEGEGEFQRVLIDRFRGERGDRFWVTLRPEGGELGRGILTAVARFLEKKGARAAVASARAAEGGTKPVLVTLLGSVADLGPEPVAEGGQRSLVCLAGVGHSGLFVDHAPLRDWLRRHARGWKVLNAFSYTGTLSVACGLGGAQEVVSLDLGKPVLRWADQNWRLNALDPAAHALVGADFFEQAARWKRQGVVFDCVIIDPPSFSRGPSGPFSTAKDLAKLHALAIDLVAARGTLVSSINSEKVPRAQFEGEVRAALSSRRRKGLVLRQIELPEWIPSHPAHPEQRYLKGLVLALDAGPTAEDR